MMPIVAAIIIASLILWIIKLRAKVKHWRTAYIKMRACYRLENKRREDAQRTTREALMKADGEHVIEIFKTQVEQGPHGPN